MRWRSCGRWRCGRRRGSSGTRRAGRRRLRPTVPHRRPPPSRPPSRPATAGNAGDEGALLVVRRWQSTPPGPASLPLPPLPTVFVAQPVRDCVVSAVGESCGSSPSPSLSAVLSGPGRVSEQCRCGAGRLGRAAEQGRTRPGAVSKRLVAAPGGGQPSLLMKPPLRRRSLSRRSAALPPAGNPPAPRRRCETASLSLHRLCARQPLSPRRLTRGSRQARRLTGSVPV